MANSSFDYTTYNAPGVYTESVTGPQIGVTSATPSGVAIVGESVKYRTYTETFVIPADVSGVAQDVVLSQVGANAATLVVRNSSTNAAYTLTTDYTVTTVAGSGATLGDGNDVVSFKRTTSGGTLTAGTSVQVSYQYTNADYYKVYTFFDFDDIRDQYGPAFDSVGNLVSPLTLAAQLAFLNGATSVVAVSTTGSTSGNYTTALAKLENEPNVALVTTTSGDSTVLTAVNTHVITQSNSRHERKAIVGFDSTSSTVSSGTKTALAASFGNKRIAIVSPSSVQYFNSESNSYIYLGGQYLAVAVAGLSVRQSKAEPLTKKTVLGFSGLKENISEQQKNVETQAGLMVIEQYAASPSNLRIRHGVTTSTKDIYEREWSISSQEDALAFQIRSYLDNTGLIGGIIDDLTLGSVKATTDSALNSLVSSRIIVGYRELKVRQLVSSPDVLEVRFAWLPALPLNYIVVKFAIDVITGDSSSNTSV